MVDPRIAIAAAASILLLCTGWMIRGWYEAESKFQLEQQMSAAKAENDKLKTELGVQHAEDQKRIDELADVVRGIRVRMPKGCVQPDTAPGGAGQAAGGGALPEDPQAALDRFTAGVAKLAKESDDVVASCRVVMQWAKQQGL